MCVCVEGGRGLISKDQLEGEVPGNANCSKIPYPVTVFWLIPKANPRNPICQFPNAMQKKSGESYALIAAHFIPH